LFFNLKKIPDKQPVLHNLAFISQVISIKIREGRIGALGFVLHKSRFYYYA